MLVQEKQHTETQKPALRRQQNTDKAVHSTQGLS